MLGSVTQVVPQGGHQDMGRLWVLQRERRTAPFGALVLAVAPCWEVRAGTLGSRTMPNTQHVQNWPSARLPKPASATVLPIPTDGNSISPTAPAKRLESSLTPSHTQPQLHQGTLSVLPPRDPDTIALTFSTRTQRQATASLLPFLPLPSLLYTATEAFVLKLCQPILVPVQ